MQEENNKLDQAKDDYSLIEGKIKDAQNEIQTEYLNKKSEITIKKTELDSNIKNLREEINKYENIKDTCPTCGQKLPNVHKIDTTDLHIKLDTLIKDQENFLYPLNEIEETKNNKLKIVEEEFKESKKISLELIENLKHKINDFSDALKQLSIRKSNLELRIKEVQLEKESFKNKLKELKENINKTEAIIDDLCKKILYNNIEKDNIKSHLEIVNKMLTIATRDFRGFLLSEIINFINTKAKEYSQEIFETDKEIRLALK